MTLVPGLRSTLALIALSVMASTLLSCGQSESPRQSGGPSSQAPAPTPQTASCRLPVAWQVPENGITAGFLDPKTGVVTLDPTSGFTVVPSKSNLVETTATPQLIGWPTTPVAYSSPARRWVPSPSLWMSPDQLEYVYPELLGSVRTRIHQVDIPTGKDTVIFDGPSVYPVEWASDGLYLHEYRAPAKGGHLFRLDAGQLTTVGSDLALEGSGSTPLIGGGAAWVTAADTALGAISGQNGPIANELLRIDLATQKSEVWATFPAADARLLALTPTGDPVVAVNTSSKPSRLVLVSDRGQPTDVSWPSDAGTPFSAADDQSQTFLISSTGAAFILSGRTLSAIGAAQGVTPANLLTVVGGCDGP